VSTYSSLALVTAAVLYLLAVMAHAAEWAFARRVSLSDPVVTEQRVLVSAGSPELPDRGGPGHTRSTGAGAGLNTNQRVELFGRLGLTLTAMGFVAALLGVVLRGVAAGRAPWGNMYEFITTAFVFVVAAYLVMVAIWGMRWLGLGVAMLAAVGNGLAVTVFYVNIGPLVPALHSVWFLIHIVAAAISGAAFNIGGLASILYLIKSRAERSESVSGYLTTRLPSARRLDAIAYRFHAFAFPLWTFTVTAGAIWAQYAWGRFWGWDPKETWALVTWVIYACYLHARSTAGWRGTGAAVIGIIGLVSFWFNFIGVNLLFTGMHSYAGI